MLFIIAQNYELDPRLYWRTQGRLWSHYLHKKSQLAEELRRLDAVVVKLL